MRKPPSDIPEFARNATNLAAAGLGAKILSVTDDFFADVSRMLKDEAPVFIPDKYDDHGKWMDGWESRRRRNGGHDMAVVKLATVARITGFCVDTANFTGNYPPACRIEGCISVEDPDETTEWEELVPVSALGPDQKHYFEIDETRSWSHVRLHTYPDGGVARFHVYGRARLYASEADGRLNLASALAGARIIEMSDAHYGDYRRILSPQPGINMGDGWETRRRREPGNDWIVVQLAGRGLIEEAIIDTAFYKGNYPDAASIQGADLTGFAPNLTDAIVTSSMFWDDIVAKSPLQADSEHKFNALPHSPVTHIRLNIFPDGGISRLRLWGRVA